MSRDIGHDSEKLIFTEEKLIVCYWSYVGNFLLTKVFYLTKIQDTEYKEFYFASVSVQQ